MANTSPIVTAYTQQQSAVPSAGVAALSNVSPTAGDQHPRNTAAADALLQQITQEAADEAPAAQSVPIIAGIPLLGGGGGGGGDFALQRRPRVLLGLSGSVATIKVALVCEALLKFADVHIICTKSSRHFFDESALPKAVLPVLTDEDEWRTWQRVGDAVVHIELRRWADVFLIAPLSANSLAKIANGLCDNLLTCVVRAWDFRKPLLVAPAMNTYMWESPFTEQHLGACRKLAVKVIAPVEKRLACGDVGNGGMAAPDVVADVVREACSSAGFLVEELEVEAEQPFIP